MSHLAASNLSRLPALTRELTEPGDGERAEYASQGIPLYLIVVMDGGCFL